VVTHQLQVERRTGKVRRPETTFYHCATPQGKTTNTFNQKTTIKTVCDGHSLITGVMTVMQPFAKLL